MPVQKVSFESSILNNMATKAASYQDTQKPESKQVEAEPQKEVQPPANQDSEKPKSHKTRNTIIGLGAAAILITLGVAGRKGKLGPKIQEFLGGAENAAAKNEAKVSSQHPESPHTDSTPHSDTPGTSTTAEAPQVTKDSVVEPKGSSANDTPSGEGITPNAHSPASPIEDLYDTTGIQKAIAKLDPQTQAEIAKINGSIDQTIPHIDESLKSIKIPTEEEIMQTIRKEVDIDSIDFSKCYQGVTGEYLYVLQKDEYRLNLLFDSNKKLLAFQKPKIYVGFNDKTMMVKFEEKGESYSYNNGKLKIAAKELSDNSVIIYNIENGNISGIVNSSRRVHFENGEIFGIDYKDPTTGNPLKEVLVDSGRVICETYYINGNMVKVVV